MAIYSRKSKFTDKGESVQNQVDLCKEYGKLHFNTGNFIIYEDEGFSGGNTNRPQFKKLLEDMKTKKFDVLICYRLDRISRNISDFSKLIELLQKYDIAFVSIKEQFDTSTPMGRAMMYIALVFAQLERETIAERIRDNMMQLARTGRWLGGITPTGFKSQAITYYDNHMHEKKMYQLTSIPQELKMVKTLYEKFLELGSLTQLESWCLENNLRTKNDKCFDKSSLKLILTNPVYAIADKVLYKHFQDLGMDIANHEKDFDGNHGVLVYNRSQETKGKTSILKKYSDWIVAVSKHKGIITSVDWIKTQNLLKENSKKAPRSGDSQVALLTPLLVCAHCGSKLKVTYKVNKGQILHHYYKCTLKERSRGSLCKTKNLNGKQSEEIVVEELKKLPLPENKLFHTLHAKKSSLSKFKENQDNKRNSLKKKLMGYEKIISNLTLKLAKSEGTVTDRYIIEEIEKTDKKIREVKVQLERLRDRHKAIQLENINYQVVEQTFRGLSLLFTNANFEEKKKILQVIIKNILWDGEKLEINIYGGKE
ncbi:MAG: recombinase family protein [Clostridiaceae bacterium]|nr:recombinase family protein [Clostridiaceae bacterium]